VTATIEVPVAGHTGPRTDELPMAFTTWEFVRGALIAYGLFLAFTAVAWIWIFVIGSIIAVAYVAPFGFASLILVGIPLAYLTGLLLRREIRTGVHLFWHGLVGLVAGGAGIVFGLCILGPDSAWAVSAPHLPDFSLLASGWIIALVEALLTVAAAMAGWRITSRKALRG
jgi:hypothetical protein